jgi:hypothetical protein
MLQAHQRVGVAKRQRLDQDGSDDGEDCGGRADPERECQHRDQRENGRSPQRANCVAKVEQRILKERRTELNAKRTIPITCAVLFARIVLVRLTERTTSPVR